MSERRARRLGWTLILGVAGAFAAPPPAGIEEVMAALGRVQQVEATYTETLESALLATVATSHGRLVYRAPDRISKTDEGGDSVQIDGDRILVHQGAQVHEIAVQDHPGVERLVAAMRAVFTGDLGRLRRDYRLEFTAAAGDWDLTLHPLDRQLLNIFERMRIHGRGEAIIRIEIEEPNGDRRSTQYQILSRQPAPPPGDGRP